MMKVKSQETAYVGHGLEGCDRLLMCDLLQSSLDFLSTACSQEVRKSRFKTWWKKTTVYDRMENNDIPLRGEKMIHKISGGTSSLELYEDYLVIKPSNIHKLNGQTQTIPLDSVVTISIVKPFLRVPYLQAITPNLQQTRNDNMKGAAANVVLIQPGNMKRAKKIRDYITNYKSKRSTSQDSSLSGSIDDLKKLSELKDSGVITQEEFDAKKKQILGL